jgi:hypothetical protein
MKMIVLNKGETFMSLNLFIITHIQAYPMKNARNNNQPIVKKIVEFTSIPWCGGQNSRIIKSEIKNPRKVIKGPKKISRKEPIIKSSLFIFPSPEKRSCSTLSFDIFILIFSVFCFLMMIIVQ